MTTADLVERVALDFGSRPKRRTSWRRYWRVCGPRWRSWASAGCEREGKPANASSQNLVPDSGQQTLDLINSVRMGTASGASSKQESTPSPHPGVLANAASDTALTQGAATAAIKGLGDIPGEIGT